MQKYGKFIYPRKKEFSMGMKLKDTIQKFKVRRLPKRIYIIKKNSYVRLTLR